MPNYMLTAAKANKVALQLVDLVSPENRAIASAMIAHLVNYGVRCNPRAAHRTIRLNSVTEAVKGLPVKIQMTEVTDKKTGKTFNALSATPIGEKEAMVEAADGDDE